MRAVRVVLKVVEEAAAEAEALLGMLRGRHCGRLSRRENCCRWFGGPGVVEAVEEAGLGLSFEGVMLELEEVWVRLLLVGEAERSEVLDW